MALELRLQFCTFEDSTKCYEVSFDPHSCFEQPKGLLRKKFVRGAPWP